MCSTVLLVPDCEQPQAHARRLVSTRKLPGGTAHVPQACWKCLFGEFTAVPWGTPMGSGLHCTSPQNM